MEWATLANTALGGFLAVAGGFLGALISERRVDARERRAREHEREVWARGLRFEAHVAFLTSLDEKVRTIEDAHRMQASMPSEHPSEPPDDFLLPVWDRYSALRLVCDAGTAVEAEGLLQILGKFAFGNGQWQQVHYQRDKYLGAVRQEFGLSPIPLMGE